MTPEQKAAKIEQLKSGKKKWFDSLSDDEKKKLADRFKKT